ncbi:hypothetical protein [Leucobacter sp. OH1287]|nr:hypothetical protein [Leucobacter sp. OH1287]
MSENHSKSRYSRVTRHLAKGSIASTVAIGLVIAGAPVSAPLAA